MAEDDSYDYCMSDLFVSETRPRPYVRGFRIRRHPPRPSLAYLNSLPDREFSAYVRNGCRLLSATPDHQDDLMKVRAELQELKAEMQILRQAMSRTAPNSSSTRGGLDVAPLA